MPTSVDVLMEEGGKKKCGLCITNADAFATLHVIHAELTSPSSTHAVDMLVEGAALRVEESAALGDAYEPITVVETRKCTFSDPIVLPPLQDRVIEVCKPLTQEMMFVSRSIAANSGHSHSA